MDTTLRDPLVGRMLDHRYRVESRIAVGGMATVYRALDTRLDRVLALKVMHPNLAADAEFTGRFIREAKAVAKLSHSNVVGVFDQGRDGDHVFLAMEFVDGCTLRDVLRSRGALSPRVALDILEPVVAALGAAHRAGLIHRDVKPENVLIASDGRVKVADFGLVRAVSGDTAGSTSTTAGTILGTVAYLAPEQIEHGTADTRTDVYACGLLLYELLTGARPQEGATPAQAMHKRLTEPIPAPSVRLPGLAPQLDALIARTTAHDPGRRPEDAVALLAEVQQLRRTLTDAQLDREPPAAAAAAGSAASGPVPLPADAAEAGPGFPTAGGDDGLQRTRVQHLPAGLVEQAPADVPPPPQAPAPRVRRPRNPRRIRALALTAAVVLLGGGIAWWALAGRYTAAPALLGTSRAAAAAKLDKAGLQGQYTQRFSESVPSGHVLSADPSAGEDVRDGGTVHVVLSKGPERHDVPELKGRTVAESERLLKERSLIVGAQTQAYSSSVPKSRVVSTRPETGTALAPGTAVDLVVSRGPAPADVPAVTGESVEEAKQDLRDAGFKVVVGHTPVASPDVPKGKVAKQSPSGTAARGSRITVWISKGPEMAVVPDVSGESVDEAKQDLTAAGFEPHVGFKLFGGGGKVKSTDPKAGSKAPKGSKVELDTGGL